MPSECFINCSVKQAGIPKWDNAHSGILCPAYVLAAIRIQTLPEFISPSGKVQTIRSGPSVFPITVQVLTMDRSIAQGESDVCCAPGFAHKGGTRCK